MYDRRHSATHTMENTVAEEVWLTIGDDGAILPVLLLVGGPLV